MPRKSSHDGSPRAELWRRGIVGAWKFDSTELGMSAELHQKLELENLVVLLCCRRMGKTFTVGVDMVEYAIKNPGAQLKFISSTKNNIKKYLNPMFDEILQDCPVDVRPRWLKQDAEYRFPNGAVIALYGTDSQHFKDLRGQAAHYVVIDECSFMSDLRRTVVDVLKPQMLTNKGSKMVLMSSAPDVPGHDFAQFIADAREKGACVERTIYQREARGNPLKGATAEAEAEENARRLAQAIEDCGGEATSAFRREYMNDLGSTDNSRAAMPGLNDDLLKGTDARPGAMRGVFQPPYVSRYTSIDLGFIDHSAIVLGYLTPGNPAAQPPERINKESPPSGCLVITDVFTAVKKTSDELVPLVRDLERTRWGSEKPFLRVVDGTPEQITQMHRVGLEVMKTRNDKPDVAIDELMNLIRRGLLIFDPRVEWLVNCCRAAVWKKTGDRLDRHAEYGHFDALMALAYMARNLRRYHDPAPVGHNSGPKGPGFGNSGVSATVRGLRDSFKSRLPFG